MLFTSEAFLFLFLPFTVLIYYLFLVKHTLMKNVFLLIMSLAFYAYGEPKNIILMIIMIILHYCFAMMISWMKQKDNHVVSKILLSLIVGIDICILGYFKYADFLINNINALFHQDFTPLQIALPIGISFYTFQSLSYVIDVYRGTVEVQRNPLYVGLYISLFPQLIAGPIVRYETIEHEIEHRKENIKAFSIGVNRFIVGLGKKVLLANQFAIVADAAFNASSRTVFMAWFGAIAYTLQIFFDFAGYSDMAIGLGRMFGFHFLENFKFPYIARSITEFWRRWHMSLQTWFKDYVYIPLGGSRVSVPRHIFNMFVVWGLTGLWHGANWTFVTWGLMYFVLLVIEKYTHLEEKLGPFAHLYTMLFVMLGWVLFRSDSIAGAGSYLLSMIGIGSKGLIDSASIEYLQRYWIYLILGIICCFPIIHNLNIKLRKNMIYNWIYIIVMSAILIISIMFIFSNAYNPFIYFNF